MIKDYFLIMKKISLDFIIYKMNDYEQNVSFDRISI